QDGGGVRGYSMLVILQELMHRTYVEIEGRAPKRHEIPKPCDHFDLIAGTGTGGLIAIMLGRLRLDIETCKDVYVRMTKRVFETDKTFAGIPYRSTLFKASKLEEAIQECVREHSLSEEEGNDDAAASANELASPRSPVSPRGGFESPQRSPSTASHASRYSQIGMTPVNMRGPYATRRWGNPNALLYDNRENRTKTAVTAVYKGTPKNGKPVLLRSYDSRAEPPPEFECTIWQAGRATSATGLAFKPIRIGQHTFIDEGQGKYNPAPQILDEAVKNEWPGRDVGVFISIGTGKRPPGTSDKQHLWWEGFVGSGMGDFAEARRRLIQKIEGCEDTHQYMLKDHLSKRHVSPENYYRLNVEVGVGEFGMNEWNRLAEISTSSRMYLSRHEVQGMNRDAAAKMARIHKAKIRWERQMYGRGAGSSAIENDKPLAFQPPPPSNPMAVELPAEEVIPSTTHSRNPSDYLSPTHYKHPSIDDKMVVFASDEYPIPVASEPRSSGEMHFNTNPHSSVGSFQPSPRYSVEEDEERRNHTPPPLPPKTPLPYPDPNGAGQGQTSPHTPVQRPPSRAPGGVLPYPDMDGPPPVVNMARKPEFHVR
ncbi:FabD/lysophospholipase-like protein, partial [Saccharata proteae CBS 121410]